MAPALADKISEMVPMRSGDLEEPLPQYVQHPLKFREKGSNFEGKVDHPKELVRLFEPVDVVDGAMELVDRNGLVITIGSTDPLVAENNEYPKSLRGLFYNVLVPGEAGRREA
jgi:hypothetical protein